MNNTRPIITAIPLIVFATLWLITGCAQTVPPHAEPTASRYAFARVVMGTRCRILLFAPSESLAARAGAAAFERIAEIDRALSDYNPNSEASRLVTKTPGVWHTVSADLAIALERSKQVHAASHGAFDPTVGPATRLWRETRRTHALPNEQARAAALASIGLDRIEVDGSRVRFHHGGIRLDFGGIGKGMACDEAAAVLRQHGINAYLIDFGGDILAGDPPHGEGRRGWTVEIRDGLAEHAARTIANTAIATSGDAEQFIEIDGARYSHIVDPRTALGVRDRRAATVLAEHAWLADALASAVCIGDAAARRSLRERFPDAEIILSGPMPAGTERSQASSSARDAADQRNR